MERYFALIFNWLGQSRLVKVITEGKSKKLKTQNTH